MQKLAIGLAALAAISFSGMAFAEEATTATTGPAAMTDAEMDGVTAAGGPPSSDLRGFGVEATAVPVRSGNAAQSSFPPVGKGAGKTTNPGPATP